MSDHECARLAPQRAHGSMPAPEDFLINGVKIGYYHDRLTKRREEVMATLRHLRKEQEGVEENKEWIDQAAYKSRLDLLDGLTGWYLEERAEIDHALTRIAEKSYGLCRACRQAIDSRRLEAAPAAEFCAACMETREGLQAM